MKKLDLLILKSFIGPFLLTTTLATFILVVQYMLKYFDDFVGKDLGIDVFAELIFYFSLNMLQIALPLGVLVSSLMTFGNLGEHFELTAIKSAGISLSRALMPMFLFVLILTMGAFHFNNIIVPAANLKAYSLLYDIKHTKPALDIKQGVFYDGIPNYSIKAGMKYADNSTLQDVMIYDHTRRDGNRRVILADSCRMYTILNEKYLKFELYKGNFFYESDKGPNQIDDLTRTHFERLDMVFSLLSFDLKRTKEELFQNNRQMKNINELSRGIDSIKNEQRLVSISTIEGGNSFIPNSYYWLKITLEKMDSQFVLQRKPIFIEESSLFPQQVVRKLRKQLIMDDSTQQSTPKDTTNKVKMETIDTLHVNSEVIKADTLPIWRSRDWFFGNKTAQEIIELTQIEFDSIFNTSYYKGAIAKNAANQARSFKVNVNSSSIRMNNLEIEHDRYVVEKYKKYSQAVACIIMFLIGAPLGAIIKKGGLGVPVIISIFFFLSYYVLSEMFHKWAKADLMEGEIAVWMPNLILLPFGFFFLRQARIDARLFDSDIYFIFWDKIKQKLERLGIRINK